MLDLRLQSHLLQKQPMTQIFRAEYCFVFLAGS